MKTTSNRGRSGVILVALALVAAACGGDDSSGSDTPSPTDPTPSPTAVPDDGDDGDAGDGDGDGDDGVAGSTTAELVFFDAAGNSQLDPHDPQSNSSLSQEQLWAVYDRLVHLTMDGDPIPGLATSWEYNDDLTVITFELRDDVVFHDGTPFNAEAVVANFDRMRELGDDVGATVRNGLLPIESWSATGDHTVEFLLNSPNGQMPYWFSQQPGMMISPASFADGSRGVDLDPIGTGPYIVDSFISLEVTRFVRNDDYWGGGVDQRPAAFEHHYVTEGQARLNAARSGQANLAIIDGSQIPAAEAAGLEVQINFQTSLWNFYVNHNDDRVTSDVRVRQAIMYAIDRNAIVDALTFGSGQASNQLFPVGHPVYLEELADEYAHNPERARELLAEAGYGDGMTLDWVLLNTSEYRQIGEAIQQMLAEVGVTVEFEVVDIAQASIFYDPSGPRGDVMMARWGGRPDPLMTFQETVGPTGLYSVLGATASPELDDMIIRAQALDPSDPARLELLRDINREFVAQAANFPVFIRSNVFVYQPDCISGLEPFLAAGDDIMNDVRVAEDC